MLTQIRSQHADTRSDENFKKISNPAGVEVQRLTAGHCQSADREKTAELPYSVKASTLHQTDKKIFSPYSTKLQNISHRSPRVAIFVKHFFGGGVGVGGGRGGVGGPGRVLNDHLKRRRHTSAYCVNRCKNGKKKVNRLSRRL